MTTADFYIKGTIEEILFSGTWDEDPRPKWGDGTPAHSKFVTQKVFQYNIKSGEYPITTLRKTALKGAFHDIESIYIKQTNIVNNMHPSIHGWWRDFAYEKLYMDEDGRMYPNTGVHWLKAEEMMEKSHFREVESIGQTYGYIVNKYALMDKLLRGLEENPFSRRHIIDMWQYTEQHRDLQALLPCAYSTLWSVRGKGIIDLTLIQRSQDFCMTASINPIQYVMLGMMVCNHLTHKTGEVYEMGNFTHFVQNCHIYDRHFGVAEEILSREPIRTQPKISLNCEPKDFYEHTWEDFSIDLPEGIKKLNTKLELAI